MTIASCKICDGPARTLRSVYCSAECFRQSEREYGIKHRKKFSKFRRRASDIVYTAVQRKKLLPQPCEVCATTFGVEAHHDDYAAPLDVRWLCRSHHRQHHVKFGPGKNAFAEA